MKRALYIGSAVLAAAGAAFYLPELLNLAHTVTLWDRPELWYPVVGRFAQFGVVIVFVIFALLQLGKPTPRLLLLLSGAMFFDSFNLIIYGQLFGLFFLAAGIMPVILEISRVPKPAGRLPMLRERYDGLLMVAGVLAILGVGYSVITAIANTLTFISMGIDIPVIYLILYAPILLGIVQSVCLGLFCFKKDLRASVLYRMFFMGSAVVSVLLIPANIVYYSMLPVSLMMNWIAMPLGIALVLLVLIHTAKTSRFNPLPQECTTPPPYAPSFTA